MAQLPVGCRGTAVLSERYEVTRQCGVNCLIVDVARARPTVLAVDSLLRRDECARRSLKEDRRRVKTGQANQATGEWRQGDQCAHSA